MQRLHEPGTASKYRYEYGHVHPPPESRSGHSCKGFSLAQSSPVPMCVLRKNSRDCPVAAPAGNKGVTGPIGARRGGPPGPALLCDAPLLGGGPGGMGKPRGGGPGGLPAGPGGYPPCMGPPGPLNIWLFGPRGPPNICGGICGPPCCI